MTPPFVPLMFFLITLTASTTKAAQCDAKDDCAANSKVAEEVRHYSAIGVKSSGRKVFDQPANGWFAAEWNKTMGKIVIDPQTCAFDNHYPAIAAKFRWSKAYVDELVKPTRSQARDPNWSNYIWNQKDKSSESVVFDGISNALGGDLIDHGRGIAKLSVIVGLTATSDNLLPPAWMRTDKSLTWLEGENKNGKSSNWHVRFDNPVAVDHAADFLAAFLGKYGNDKGLHSINLGEYYFGQAKYIPSGLDKDKYRVGVKNLWSKIVQSAPRDSNGKRVNIVQANPLFSSQVTIEDMENIGVGITVSDIDLDFPISKRPETAALRNLYDRGRVHVMIDGDARYACDGRRQRWDGTPNPFGHGNGFTGVATPQEAFWYHSESGPAPTHSIFMTIATWCSSPQTTANFVDAVKKFGRCGTETSEWGVAPATFPGGVNVVDSTPSSKPSPPQLVVN